MSEFCIPDIRQVLDIQYKIDLATNRVTINDSLVGYLNTRDPFERQASEFANTASEPIITSPAAAANKIQEKLCARYCQKKCIFLNADMIRGSGT